MAYNEVLIMLIKQRYENDPLNLFVQDFLVGKQNLIGIEIGSYRGESAEIFLKSNAFKTLYCIDPWIPGYDSRDQTSSVEIIHAEEEFDKKFNNNQIIKKIKQKSSDAINLFEDNSIDFIYIDANHKYEFVKWDIENYVLKVKKGGIISGHDYSSCWEDTVKRAVDEYFKKPPLKVYAEGSWIYIKE